MKQKEKILAINLRKQGFSYNEIRRKVSVSKSSLSLWLRSVGLSKRQKQRLTEKKLASIQRGHDIWRQYRIKTTEDIKKQAFLDIKKIRMNEYYLWLMGIMLYWAEGAKSKENNISQGVCFSNSDPFIIKMFLLWLKQALKIEDSRIKLEIYIHETHKAKVHETKKYWSRITGFSESKFDKIYYKKNKLNTKRKNVGENYHGLLRVLVRKSTDLNRHISGWTEGICHLWGVV